MEAIDNLIIERFSLEQTVQTSIKRLDYIEKELENCQDVKRDIYMAEPSMDMLDSDEDPVIQCRRLFSKYFTSEQTETLIDYLEKRGLFIAPASTKYHGNWQGGLWQHSLTVARELIKLTNRLNLQWQNPRSPMLVGICHDLCKSKLYKRESFSGNYISVKDEYNKGHGNYSVNILKEMLSLIGETITEEEELCIRYHMGAYIDLSSKEYVQREWNDLRDAIEKYPTVLYTHTADMIASGIKGT